MIVGSYRALQFNTFLGGGGGGMERDEQIELAVNAKYERSEGERRESKSRNRGKAEREDIFIHTKFIRVN